MRKVSIWQRNFNVTQAGKHNSLSQKIKDYLRTLLHVMTRQVVSRWYLEQTFADSEPTTS